MRNKTLKIPLIIILGTVAFLARTFIPHHHHDSLICFVRAHSPAKGCLSAGSLSFDDIRDEAENTGSHGSDKGQEDDNCFLEQEIPVPKINEKIQISTYENNFPDELSYSDNDSLTGKGLLYIYQNKSAFLLFDKSPGNFQLTGSYPASGLRAPPAA
ncbi:MAG: hypothetical protein GX876_11105 [Bacteroidales bacterium]|nr:hypothetical protein [Bacteroidales bacterium]